jgi:hypothetical protein
MNRSDVRQGACALALLIVMGLLFLIPAGCASIVTVWPYGDPWPMDLTHEGEPSCFEVCSV